MARCDLAQQGTIVCETAAPIRRGNAHRSCALPLPGGCTHKTKEPQARPVARKRKTQMLSAAALRSKKATGARTVTFCRLWKGFSLYAVPPSGSPVLCSSIPLRRAKACGIDSDPTHFHRPPWVETAGQIAPCPRLILYSSGRDYSKLARIRQIGDERRSDREPDWHGWICPPV